ncbi:hypothetical protein H6G89_26530 [Oscillatoria sp. FACHB-1407]|nr:hypothetical protein [Oscillatoria sp. FACHB-1407]
MAQTLMLGRLSGLPSLSNVAIAIANADFSISTHCPHILNEPFILMNDKQPFKQQMPEPPTDKDDGEQQHKILKRERCDRIP